MGHRVTNPLSASPPIRLFFRRAFRSPCLVCGGARSELSLCANCCAGSAIDASFHRHTVPRSSGSLPIRALGLYWRGAVPERSPAAELLHRFKYTRERAAGRALSLLLAAYAAAAFDLRGTGLVPIPLHTRRLRARGFNQAAWLARSIAKRCAAALHPRALVRPHDDAPRPGSTALERRTSRAPLFLVGRCPPPNRPLLLVDDVCTTGVTLTAAAAALAARGFAVRGAIVLLLADRAGREDTASPEDHDLP